MRVGRRYIYTPLNVLHAHTYGARLRVYAGNAVETKRRIEERQIETDTQKKKKMCISIVHEHWGILRACTNILYTIFNWWREKEKKNGKKFDEKEWKWEKMRKNECAALFFDMMLFMPKNIGRTSWLPWWWLVRVCVRPCSIVTCYMNRIRAWSERMERKKQQQQQKTPLFILYLWVLCVHWWWVCRAFNASTGYLCVNSVEFVYNWRNREKKKKCRKINISIQIHRYAKFTSRMFSVCTPYMWPEVFHRMMDVPKCSAKWKYSRGKKREKFVIAFVFRWKSTPHFISMNIFLYFSPFFYIFSFQFVFSSLSSSDAWTYLWWLYFSSVRCHRE